MVYKCQQYLMIYRYSIMKDHVSVLLNESISALQVASDGCYIDGTYGRGGHSAAILKQLSANGKLFACDCDPEAAADARRFSQDERFQFLPINFADLAKHLPEDVLGRVNGILLDLGVSSPQLDQGERGFSFRYEAPLDMRMNNAEGQSAGSWLLTVSEGELADVIFYYGQERLSRRIAKRIVAKRHPAMTTSELAQWVLQCYPNKRHEKHPATKTFQAIRMHVNQELQSIEALLKDAPAILSLHGRLSIITFHGLERKLVKRWSGPSNDFLPFPKLRPTGRAIKPSVNEVRDNPRASSALLSTLERVA